MRGLRSELDNIRAVAFDLDGVLYEAETPVPGAASSVASLRRARVPLRFVTNTTSISRRLIVEKLERLGFEANIEEVFCPARAAAAWLLHEKASASLFVSAAALGDFAGVRQDDHRPDAVVIGDLDRGWTFDVLNHAFRLVHDGNARLIGLGRTRFWKGPHGPQLDVGPFVAALEQATGTQALIFGKPEETFFTALLDDIREPPHRVAMIGDDILTDVAAAKAVGLYGVLVRTGKFRARDLEGSIKPDLVVDSVVDLLEPGVVRETDRPG